MPVADRQLVTLFLRRQEKVTKKKATPVCRACGVPLVVSNQTGLRNSPWLGVNDTPNCGAQTVLA
jgi:hypothetical protein